MHFLNVEVDIAQQTVTVVRLGTFVIKLWLIDEPKLSSRAFNHRTDTQ
jgi:hypothetical protein